jgi:hypothetical protein
MSLSNRHTLHHHGLLQAVYALHPNHYALLSNHHAVNPALRLTEIHLDMEDLIPTIHSPIIPSAEVTSSIITLPTKPSVVPIKPKMVWKPGHGSIEKVDKVTGEIMHLVEERPNPVELDLIAA